jgi:uncharacterized membrane protein required for colicin V production
MEFIVDIVLIAIIAVSSVIGFKRGIVRTVFGCFAVAAALACAFFLAPHAGNFIKETSVYEKMSSRVVDIIDGYLDGSTENIESGLAELSQSPLSATLSRLGFDIQAESEAYLERLDEAGNNCAVTVADTVLSFLATMLGALIMFILSLIAIKLAGIILEKVFRLPVLKAINKLGGGILGAVMGIVFAYIFCTALEILLPHIPENPVLYIGMEENTVIYKFFVSTNPLVVLFLNFWR